MWDAIEGFGWCLILNGLFAVFLTAALALVRSADAPWQAFFWLYTIAWTMVFVGFKLLKWIGSWPPRT